MQRTVSNLHEPLTHRNLAALASPVFVLRVAGAFSTLVLGVTVGQRLGVGGAGDLFIALAVAVVGATIGRFGLDTVALRFVGAAAGDGHHTSSTFRTITTLVLAGSAAVAAVLLLATAPLARLLGGSELETTLRMAVAAVIPLAVLTVQIHVLRATGRATLAEAFRPLGPNLVAIGGIMFVSTSAGAMTVLACAYGVFAFAGVVVNYRGATVGTRKADTNRLLRVAGPMFVIAVLQLLMAQANTLLLGAISTSGEVGRFGAALRLSGAMTMVLSALIAISAPRFAAHHARQDRGELARLGRGTALIATLAGLPVMVVLVVLPGPILSLFGEGFESGTTALRILAAGQFANIAVGAVGYLLMMTGLETRAVGALVAGAFANLLLAVVLIPPFDAAGAAVAVACGLLVNNSLGLWFVRRELGFWNLPFPFRN